MNRLKNIREKKSLTLAQLSARTSIPVRLLGDYEENTIEIPPPHLKSLAKALWVKPDELLVAASPAPVPAPYGAPAPYTPPAAPAPYAAPDAPAPGGVDVVPAGVGSDMDAAAPASASSPAPMPYAARPLPPPMSGPPVPMGGPPRPGYAPPPGRRPAGPAPPGGDLGRGRPPMGGPARPRREPLAMPATEGQVTEILRLAARLGQSTTQLEEQFGRPMADITRFDAREWIKQLREEAAAKAPPSKIHFGQWPGLKDDLEAVYLSEQKAAAAPFRFTLFNGQMFEGALIDFTPYTVTLAELGSGDHIVLRKLAIAYYRRLGNGTDAGADLGEDASADAPAEGAEASTNGHEAHDPAPFDGSALPLFGQPASVLDAEDGGDAS